MYPKSHASKQEQALRDGSDSELEEADDPGYEDDRIKYRYNHLSITICVEKSGD